MHKRLFVIVFCVLIGAPYVNMVFDILPELELKEKRELEPKPVFEASELYSYLDKYKAYFEDHYGFRGYLVKANLFLKLTVFKKSSSPATVMLGKEDWLYVSPNMDLLLNKKVEITELKHMQMMEASLLEKTREFAAHGIKYYVMLLPEKSYVYPEYLPKAYRDFDSRRRLDVLINYLQQNKELNILDVSSVLEDSKKNHKEDIYYKNDSHWNHLGAFDTYLTFLEQAQKDFKGDYPILKTPFTWKKETIDDGDLADIILTSGNVTDYIYTYLPKDSSQFVFDKAMYIGPNINNYKYTNEERKGNPNILFLHDSFGNYFKYWLINDFHTTHTKWIKRFNFSTDSLIQLKPDFVLHEMVPRNSVLMDLVTPR